MVRRSIVIFATLLILTLNAASLAAQGRGGQRGASFGGPPPRGGSFGAPPPRPAPVQVPFATRVPGPPVQHRGVVFGPSVVGPSIGGIYGRGYAVVPQRRVVVQQPYVSPYVYGTYLPYIGVPSIYAPYPYAAVPAYVAPVEPATSVRQTETDLSYQVERLSREIEQLRQDQAAAAARPQVASPPPQAEPPAPQLPTTLVFRDGHRLIIQNYAIVGQTLWIFDEQNSTKIALSDLNLEATQAENRANGVRFPVPAR